jgi:hypothetical protein
VSKGLEKLRADKRVETVDDERKIGNSIIVGMAKGWTLDARDPHDGVFGADTLKEAWATLKTAVQII